MLYAKFVSKLHCMKENKVPFKWSSKIPCEQLVSSTPNERETNHSLGSSKKAPQREKSGKKVSKFGCTKVPASNRTSYLHWTRKTCDIF